MSRKLGAGEFLFSARCEIDYLNEKYNLQLPDGDYDTLGGMVINFSERIPDVHEKVRLEGFVCTIEKMDGARIGEIHLQQTESGDE